MDQTRQRHCVHQAQILDAFPQQKVFNDIQSNNELKKGAS